MATGQNGDFGRGWYEPGRGLAGDVRGDPLCHARSPSAKDAQYDQRESQQRHKDRPEDSKRPCDRPNTHQAGRRPRPAKDQKTKPNENATSDHEKPEEQSVRAGIEIFGQEHTHPESQKSQANEDSKTELCR